MPRSSTRIARARTESSASASGFPGEFLSQHAVYFHFDFSASCDDVLGHGLFERSRRRPTVLRELEGRDPDVRIQYNNHCELRFRRRVGFPERTS